MITAGQIYEAVRPNRADPYNTRRRIRVIGKHIGSKLEVETVLSNGRGERRRRIEASELHETATTKHGKPRRSGYVLLKNTCMNCAGPCREPTESGWWICPSCSALSARENLPDLPF